MKGSATNNELGPRLVAWEVCFLRIDGLQNRRRAVQEICDFLNDTLRKEMFLPGYAFLKGIVYGNFNFMDGREIFTSYINKIEKIRLDGPYSQDIDWDCLCVETERGVKYYISLEEQHVYNYLLFSDWLLRNTLCSRPGAYLPSVFRETILL